MVYGPTPPDGVMTTDPVDAPLQSTLVIAVVAVIAVGCVIVTGTVIVQLFASFTVNVCGPAFNPVCTGVMVEGPTPPDGVMTTDPVDAPLQSTLVIAVVAVIAVGCVIVTGTVIVQLFASFTVNVCGPAFNPVCTGVMVEGPTPPDGVMTTDPVDAPLQSTLVIAVVAVIAVGCVIVIATVVAHPFASVTVNVCSPAASPVCTGVMVYGNTPPDGVMTTDPVAAPLQTTLVIAVVAVIAVGCVIVTGTVIVQLFASFTVNVYDPAASPVCTGVMV